MEDLIAYTGSSGTGGAGNHLHFEIRQNENPTGGKAGVYSGGSIKIVDNPNINLEKMKANGDGRAYFSVPQSPGELNLIPEGTYACDVPLPATNGLCTNDGVNYVPCGWGLKPNGEGYTGNEICERLGLGACLYAGRDGGMACKQK